MGSVLRVSVSKTKIKATMDRRIKSLKNFNDPQLKKEIATAYAEQTHRFVPYDDSHEGHHLHDYYISGDGRVIYTRRNSKGAEISSWLNQGGRTGKWHTRFAGHEPESFWGQVVYNRANEWDAFIKKANVFIRAYVRRMKGK